MRKTMQIVYMSRLLEIFIGVIDKIDPDEKIFYLKNKDGSDSGFNLEFFGDDVATKAKVGDVAIIYLDTSKNTFAAFLIEL